MMMRFGVPKAREAIGWVIPSGLAIYRPDRHRFQLLLLSASNRGSTSLQQFNIGFGGLPLQPGEWVPGCWCGSVGRQQFAVRVVAVDIVDDDLG